MLGLLVPSWYRLHQALMAPCRGIQAGRRMSMRYVMDYWDADKCQEDLHDYTILIRLVYDTRVEVSHHPNGWSSTLKVHHDSESRLTTAWSVVYDGTSCRIALPFSPIVANLQGPSEVLEEKDVDSCNDKVKCSGLWRALLSPMDVGFGYEGYRLQTLGVEMALHHKSLGYAKLGSWDMQGALEHTIRGDVRGQLCPGESHDSTNNWWRSEAVHDAIAEGETLRFRRWATEENFGDNPDARSAAAGYDECIFGQYQDLEVEMIARWRDSSWEVGVEALHWSLLEERDKRSAEERRQWYERLKDQNVSLPAVLASQLSWLPD